MEEKEIEKLLRNLSEKKACQKSDTPLKSDSSLESSATRLFNWF